MGHVNGMFAYTGGRLSSDQDKYYSANKRIAALTGNPMAIVFSGISSYGKHRYEPDGFVYRGRRKTPVGRYIRLERCANYEVALRPGRLQEISTIEALRWRILLRIHNQLGPELEKRGRKLRRYKRSFMGYYNKQLYQITCRRGLSDAIEFNEVNTSNQKHATPLDHMAADWTSEEDDRMAAYFISMADRVARAWAALNLTSSVLSRAFDGHLREILKFDPEWGELADLEVNGRRYLTWVGRGGRFKNHDDVFELWPNPMRKRISIGSQEPAMAMVRS